MSASGDFGPAPAGIDLSENQNKSTYAAVITLMVLGTAAVAVRTYARVKENLHLGLDDYLVFAGLFFAHCTAICTLISVPWGNGRHLWALTTTQFTVVWKILFAYVMIYAAAVTCTKASIVMFYRRIFGIQKSLYLCLFLVLSYFITIVVTINVACRPLPYFWTQYTDPTATGKCINISKFFFANGIWAMLVDVVILCVPIPIVRGLQMPMSQKVAVLGILLLGSFVCVASIVRIIMLKHNLESDDPTWTINPVFIWSCVEPFVGIICACLPTFAAFFRRWWGAKRGSNKRSGDSASIQPVTIGSISTGNPHKKMQSHSRWGRPPVEHSLFETKAEDDEVYLTTNVISGRHDGSVKTKDSEESGVPMHRIVVREDVDVSSRMYQENQI